MASFSNNTKGPINVEGQEVAPGESVEVETLTPAMRLIMGQKGGKLAATDKATGEGDEATGEADKAAADKAAADKAAADKAAADKAAADKAAADKAKASGSKG